MKRTIQTIALALGAALLLPATPALAHFTLDEPDGRKDTDPDAGIDYRGTVGLHGWFSPVSDTYHTGAWSWEDGAGNGTSNTGWTHTSNWYAIRLDIGGVFTLTISPTANVPWSGGPNGVASTDGMYPSFTLYSGHDNDGEYGREMEYVNNGPNTWAEDLTYITHLNNSTKQSITISIPLAAGEYTVVIGSNSPSTTNAIRQGYTAEFAIVPEPSSALLGAAGAVALLGRRRRAA
jgi:hypothetical protein